MAQAIPLVAETGPMTSTTLSVVALAAMVSLYSEHSISADIRASTIPDSLDLKEFATLSQQMSEEDGEFHSDNFVSNESSYLHPVEVIRRLQIHNGVYIGVGPEQNYTYIAEIRPEIAFIVDIRRQNMLLHLLYKSLFSLSDSRLEFLSKLFSKPLPEDLPILKRFFYETPTWYRTGAIPEIMDLIGYFDSVEPSEKLYRQTLNKILRSVESYGITNSDDLDTITYIYRAFYVRQFDIEYDVETYDGTPIFSHPNLRQLLTSTTTKGEMANFLATRQRFELVKEMHRRNLIVPVVGDFAGRKSLRSIARFVLSHNAVVSAFYTSNVEMYLSTSYNLDVEYEKRDRFYFDAYFENIRTLPIDESSVFIRAFHNDDRFGTRRTHPDRIDNLLFTTIVQPISGFLQDQTWCNFSGYERYMQIVTSGILK